VDAGGAGGDSDGGVWALPDDAGKPAGSSGGRLRVDHLHSRSGLAHAQPAGKRAWALCRKTQRARRARAAGFAGLNSSGPGLLVVSGNSAGPGSAASASVLDFLYLICHDFRKIIGRIKIFDKCTSNARLLPPYRTTLSPCRRGLRRQESISCASAVSTASGTCRRAARRQTLNAVPHRGMIFLVLVFLV
jgi:hypothetical protein